MPIDWAILPSTTHSAQVCLTFGVQIYGTGADLYSGDCSVNPGSSQDRRRNGFRMGNNQQHNRQRQQMHQRNYKIARRGIRRLRLERIRPRRQRNLLGVERRHFDRRPGICVGERVEVQVGIVH